MVHTGSITLGERVYTVTQLPAMRAAKLIPRLGKMLGPTFARMLTMPGASGLAGLLKMDVGALAPAVETLFDRLTETELESLIKLMLESATVDGRPLLVRFDTEMQGRILDLFKLLKFAFEVNYTNFSQGSDASDLIAPIPAASSFEE